MSKELLEEYDQYPYIFKYSSLIIVGSPVANCQTYSVGNASDLVSFSQEDIKDFIEALKERLHRRQCIIDLKDSVKEAVLAKLQPFIEWEQHIEYTNNTGTLMTLYLIKFD